MSDQGNGVVEHVEGTSVSIVIGDLSAIGVRANTIRSMS
jgi:hypothetical protein